jgi:hypothetical protein
MKECKNCSERMWRASTNLTKHWWCFAYGFLTPEAKEKNKKTRRAHLVDFENFSLNKDGDCKYYKKLWYKFWVK